MKKVIVVITGTEISPSLFSKEKFFCCFGGSKFVILENGDEIIFSFASLNDAKFLHHECKGFAEKLGFFGEVRGGGYCKRIAKDTLSFFLNSEKFGRFDEDIVRTYRNEIEKIMGMKISIDK